MKKRRAFRPQVAEPLEPRLTPSTYHITIVNRTSEVITLYHKDRYGNALDPRSVAPGVRSTYDYSVTGNAPLWVEGIRSHRHGDRSIVTNRSYFVTNSGANDLRIGDL